MDTFYRRGTVLWAAALEEESFSNEIALFMRHPVPTITSQSKEPIHFSMCTHR